MFFIFSIKYVLSYIHFNVASIFNHLQMMVFHKVSKIENCLRGDSVVGVKSPLSRFFKFGNRKLVLGTKSGKYNRYGRNS